MKCRLAEPSFLEFGEQIRQAPTSIEKKKKRAVLEQKAEEGTNSNLSIRRRSSFICPGMTPSGGQESVKTPFPELQMWLGFPIWTNSPAIESVQIARALLISTDGCLDMKIAAKEIMHDVSKDDAPELFQRHGSWRLGY
jgi:hypothetical protein